jgi:exportin-2 (importin alpha re-exporter)
LNLYIGKYEEEFTPFYPTFLQDVWTLLLKVSNEAKFDLVHVTEVYSQYLKLVTAAIQFLGSASTSVHYKHFSEPDVLKMICEKIVIPNLKLRDVDLEMFEDQPIEYIRRDIEVIAAMYLLMS